MKVMSEEFTQLSELIKAEMRKRDWSTRDLERESGVSRDTVSRLTRGDGPFSAAKLDQIANALGLDSDYVKQLAGIIRQRNVIIENPDVLEIAKELDALSESARNILIPNIRQLMQAYQNVTLVAEAKAARPDLADLAEQLKREKQAKADKIESV